MKTSINFRQISTQLSHLLHRFHVVLFALIAVGGLSAATFLLNQTLSSSSVTNNTKTSPAFDTATMERVKKLNKTTNETKPLELPAGRINPFIKS
jgi:hypothetical protein